MVQPPEDLEPAKLISYSCSLKKILQCTCSFHGVPAPSVTWWMENDIVGVDSTDDSPHVTSTILSPWANTTISLTKLPEIGKSLLCEGRNDYGNHAMTIILMSIKSTLVTKTFINGLLQGFIFGVILTTLLFLCLIPLTVKFIRKKLTKKIETIDEEESPNVKACQEPTMSLKPEEPEKSIITSSESKTLVVTHCV